MARKQRVKLDEVEHVDAIEASEETGDRPGPPLQIPPDTDPYNVNLELVVPPWYAADELDKFRCALQDFLDRAWRGGGVDGDTCHLLIDKYSLGFKK